MPLNMGRFSIFGVGMMIFGFQEAPRVCYTLPKQSASYIQYFWKNHFSNIGKKSIFFQLFQIFHKDFSKDLWSKVIKSTCFLVRYFLLNFFKDLWYNSRKIQQIFSYSTIIQHLVNTRWPKKIIEDVRYAKIREMMM